MKVYFYFLSRKKSPGQPNFDTKNIINHIWFFIAALPQQIKSHCRFAAAAKQWVYLWVYV